MFLHFSTHSVNHIKSACNTKVKISFAQFQMIFIHECSTVFYPEGWFHTLTEGRFLIFIYLINFFHLTVGSFLYKGATYTENETGSHKHCLSLLNNWQKSYQMYQYPRVLRKWNSRCYYRGHKVHDFMISYINRGFVLKSTSFLIWQHICL